MHPDYTGYYEPLDQHAQGACRSCSPTTPKRPRQLLAEAGFPNGFTFKVQVQFVQPGPHAT